MTACAVVLYAIALIGIIACGAVAWVAWLLARGGRRYL